jgi:hypothetical protein
MNSPKLIPDSRVWWPDMLDRRLGLPASCVRGMDYDETATSIFVSGMIPNYPKPVPVLFIEMIRKTERFYSLM